jgi:hypothetical protein
MPSPGRDELLPFEIHLVHKSASAALRAVASEPSADSKEEDAATELGALRVTVRVGFDALERTALAGLLPRLGSPRASDSDGADGGSGGRLREPSLPLPPVPPAGEAGDAAASPQGRDSPGAVTRLREPSLSPPPVPLGAREDAGGHGTSEGASGEPRCAEAHASLVAALQAELMASHRIA